MSEGIQALEPGRAYGNRQIMDTFKCACEGGIRFSKATQTVVTVVNHVKGRYKCAWRDGVLDFAGSGSLGDQTLEKGLNRTLLSAFKNGLPVYLFEVFKQGEYTFDGRVDLAGEPYRREAPDREGKARAIWIFPLRRADGEKTP